MSSNPKPSYVHLRKWWFHPPGCWSQKKKICPTTSPSINSAGFKIHPEFFPEFRSLLNSKTLNFLNLANSLTALSPITYTRPSYAHAWTHIYTWSLKHYLSQWLEYGHNNSSFKHWENWKDMGNVIYCNSHVPKKNYNSKNLWANEAVRADTKGSSKHWYKMVTISILRLRKQFSYYSKPYFLTKAKENQD